MVEEQVKSIIDSLSQSVSDNFIETICLSLATAIKADFVFVAKLNDDYTIATTLSVASQREMLNNFSYALKATPCENVSKGDVCTHVANCQQAYPDDQLLIDMNIAGYVGVPLKNTNNETDSILVALYCQPIENVSEITSLFLLFSGMIKKEMEKQVLINELKTRNEIIEESKEAIVVCDKHRNITSVNKAFSRISGYSFKEVQGKNPRILGAGINDKNFYYQMWQDIDNTGAWSGEIWNKKKNGEVFPEWLSINSICDENNDVSHYVAFIFDITKQKESEAKIFKQANFDLLTGIANRFSFLEKLSHAVSTAQLNNTQSAILYMDLDLFKEINDIYGHDFGDELLIQTSIRLQSYIKSTDLVARISGDGFAILLNNIENNEVINNIVTRILVGFSKPFSIKNAVMRCTLSIGIVAFSSDKDDVGELMKKGETAMYHAKDSGRNSFNYFTQSMQNTALHQLNLKRQLIDAIKNRQLSVVYQPIVSINDEKINKFEALVRWNHQGEWISPIEFIPIAEEFSLIVELGEFVLSEACIQLKKLKDQGFNDIVFNVNRSIYEIPLNQSENDYWLTIIKLHGLQPSDICFELTESALAPDKRNNEVLFNSYVDNLKISYEDIWKKNNEINTSIKLPITISINSKKTKKII